MTFQTRAMTPADVPSCVAIINATIAVGGSTAYEDPYEHETFEAHYLESAATSFVVTFENRVVGFQSCFEVEPGIYSIGSFTDQERPVKGAGRALITATIAAARENDATAILAKITSDNTGGLAYYSKVGFEDYQTVKSDLTRRDGTVVDRIIKRFVL